MHRYELTERGKIAIAIVLVVLFLLIPSVIMLLKSMANQPAQPEDDPEQSTSGSRPPVTVVVTPPSSNITPESPPPTGGGFNPPEVIPSESVAPEGEDDIEQPVFNPDEGTLQFLFSPDKQEALGPGVTSMLIRFLSVPANTKDSLIAVELPKLADADMDKAIDVITDAFIPLGVEEQKLAFIVHTEEGDVIEEPYEIKLSYIKDPKK